MYCLRRAAFRAISTPTTSFLLKPRSIATVTPSALRTSRQIPNLAFQQRWFSDEIRKDEEAQSSSEKGTSSAGIYDGSYLFAERERSSQGRKDSREPAFDIARPVRLPKANRPSEPTETVYVGNLFFDVTAEDLSREFQRFGTINYTKVVYDQRGLSRGFAYITFDTKEAAANAIENMHLQVFEGRRLNVDFSTRLPIKEVRNTEPAHLPSKTLFIGNMSFEMTDADLNALFRDIRNVIDVRVAVDRRTGTPRGFAHADFVDVESAMEALEKLKTKAPYGRRLRLDYGMSHKNKTGQLRPRNASGSGSGSGSGSESESSGSSI